MKNHKHIDIKDNPKNTKEKGCTNFIWQKSSVF